MSKEIAKKQTTEISVPTTFKKLCVTYKVNESLTEAFTEIETVTQSLRLKTPSIAKMRKDYGEDPIKALIKLGLIELSLYVNLTRPMTEIQIDAIARTVVRKHWMLTLSDICLVFRKASEGEFGPFYEGLDKAKVIVWFDEYRERRFEAAEALSMDKSDQIKYQQEKDRTQPAHAAKKRTESIQNIKQNESKKKKKSSK